MVTKPVINYEEGLQFITEEQFQVLPISTATRDNKITIFI